MWNLFSSPHHFPRTNISSFKLRRGTHLITLVPALGGEEGTSLWLYCQQKKGVGVSPGARLKLAEVPLILTKVLRKIALIAPLQVLPIRQKKREQAARSSPQEVGYLKSRYPANMPPFLLKSLKNKQNRRGCLCILLNFSTLTRCLEFTLFTSEGLLCWVQTHTNYRAQVDVFPGTSVGAGQEPKTTGNFQVSSRKLLQFKS